jgi:thymidylate synthase
MEMTMSESQSRPHPMQQYHDLMSRVLAFGETQVNERTGKRCTSLIGEQLKFDMADGFPAVTTKELAFRAVVGELLGFFRGYQNARQFAELGCKVWFQNANETEAWLANPNRKGADDLGRIYSAQWTDWRDTRIARSEHEREDMTARGYIEKLYDAEQGAWMMERGINQVEQALRTLLTDPSDRRIIVSGWRPDEFDLCALPACHKDYAFVPRLRDGTLDLVMTIRSWDLFLGAPFNIASTALFLHIMARLSGYRPGTVTMQVVNAHIYGDHVDAVRLQLTRDHYPQPALWLSDSIAKVTHVDQIPGVFARIQPDDIRFVDYQHHPKIYAAMAA